MRSRFFLGEVVDSVVRNNPKYYKQEWNEQVLAELIPDKILNTEVTKKNFASLVDKIDRIRSKKVKEFKATLAKKEDLYKVLNSKLNTLPERQERKRREIKFLFNVAATLLHW